MTSATKVFLALFALLIGVLVLYYGVWQRADPASPGVSSASGATPSAAAVSQLKQPPREGTSRLSRSGPSNSRLPSSGTGNSSLLSEALLHSAITDPTSTPPAADTSLDSLSAADSSASRPAANTPVAINLNTPTPTGPEPLETNLTSPTTVIPSSSTEPKPSAGVQPRGAQIASNATTPTSAEVEYTVKAGDTGTSIAKAWFGDPNKWVLISKANPWADFNRLRIGQKLKMPPKDATSVKAPAAPTVAMGDKATYTVQAGDTLAGIARKQLGNAGLWEQIYNSNKSVIGDDPAALKVGMKLKLPDKAAAKRQ